MASVRPDPSAPANRRSEIGAELRPAMIVLSPTASSETDMRNQCGLMVAMAATALAIAACGSTIEQRAATGAIAGAVVGHATDDDRS